MKSCANLIGCILLALGSTMAGCSDTNIPDPGSGSEPPALEALPAFANAWAANFDAMAVDSRGLVHTSKLWIPEIVTYDEAGEIVDEWKPMIGDVAVQPVYLAACGGSVIATCDKVGETWFAKFGGRHKLELSWRDAGRIDGLYPFYWSPVAADPGGRIYILDWDRELVTQYDRTAHMITSWHPIGASPLHSNKPRGVAVSPSGVVYITVNYSVLMYNSRGTLLGEFTVGDTTPGYRLDVDGLAIDSIGAMYFVDRFGRRIIKTDAAGQYIGEFATGSDFPMPAYVAASGRNVFVGCWGGHYETGYMQRFVYASGK